MPLTNRLLPKPLFIAHRGLGGHYPENTLAAFRGAVSAGAQMIELDVTLSRDRQPAVIHDRRVDRTTDGSGLVKDLTMAELSRLDAGSWFDARFSGETIPTLAQVLDTVKGKLLVNIEIKPEAFESEDSVDAVERQIVALVTERDMFDEVLISSFAWRALARVRDLSSHISLGLLSAIPADERLFYWFKRVNGFSWHPDYRIVNRSQVATLRALGAKIFPYAVNGRIDTRTMLTLDVDGLIVDDPQQMSA